MKKIIIRAFVATKIIKPRIHKLIYEQLRYKMENNQSSFILFKTEDDKISVDVRFEDETVWLSQEQMAQLFGKGRSTIAEHIGNVFDEGELEQNRTCRKFRQVRQEGNRFVEREQAMTMKDWAEHLDKILTMSGEKLLQGAGKVSHAIAVEKATGEYKKYQQKTLSEAEKNYLESLKMLEHTAKKKK